MLFFFILSIVIHFVVDSPKDADEVKSFWQTLKEFSDILWPVLLTILILEFFLKIYTEEETKEELAEICRSALNEKDCEIQEETVEKVKCICSDLYNHKDPLLSSFNPDRLQDVTKNSLSAMLGDELAEKFVKSVVKNQLNNCAYRTDFHYSVYLRDGVGEDFCIEQILSYRKHIKLSDQDKRPDKMVVLFSFNKDPFKKVNNEDVVFFREELNHERLINDIVANQGNSERILELLDFRMRLDNDGKIPCTAELIDELIDDKRIPVGIKISAPIDKQEWEKEKDGFVSVWCHINCRYFTNQNCFYWKFPEPIFGHKTSINFSFHFDTKRISSNDVHLIKYFSGSGKERVIVSDNNITFSSKEIYFPESGIYFHW